MEPIAFKEIDDFLARSGITVADSRLGIGRELTYANPPLRTVVLYIAESDPFEYISGAISLILNFEEEWLLLSRYGSVSDLSLIESEGDFAAIRFNKEEVPTLVSYLCTRSTDPGTSSADLYVIGKSGKTLITWDHHSSDEGVAIQFQDVKDASKVLCSLNDFGAELEVFYIDR
jgi:hypothetical protein